MIPKETAQAEIEKWLDYKKVRPSKREDQKQSIDQLVSAMEDGLLVLNEDNSFTQKLSFPIEDKDGKEQFKALEFKPRIPLSLVHLHLQGVKSGDSDGRLLAHVAALTQKPKAIIQKLDTEDYAIAASIGVFFIV